MKNSDQYVPEHPRTHKELPDGARAVPQQNQSLATRQLFTTPPVSRELNFENIVPNRGPLVLFSFAGQNGAANRSFEPPRTANANRNT